MKLEIICDSRDSAILVGDEDHNDIAEFFHSDHATVGQSYEIALALARMLVNAGTTSIPNQVAVYSQSQVLLNCPFCNAAPELIEADTGTKDVWLVRCTECQCKTVNYYGKAQPVFVWNKRIAPHVHREKAVKTCPTGRPCTNPSRCTQFDQCLGGDEESYQIAAGMVDNPCNACGQSLDEPPTTLSGQIAAVYGDLDVEDCKRVDREWARMRGYILPTDGTSTLKKV